jgi:hypothetical protein
MILGTVLLGRFGLGVAGDTRVSWENEGLQQQFREYLEEMPLEQLRAFVRRYDELVEHQNYFFRVCDKLHFKLFGDDIPIRREILRKREAQSSKQN